MSGIFCFLCVSSSSPAGSCETSSKLPFPVFCFPVTALLGDAERCQFFSSWNIRGRPESAEGKSPGLAAAHKMTSILVVAAKRQTVSGTFHVRHLQESSSVPLKPPGTERDQWACSVPPGDHLNIYISSLMTAIVSKNVSPTPR